MPGIATAPDGIRHQRSEFESEQELSGRLIISGFTDDENIRRFSAELCGAGHKNPDFVNTHEICKSVKNVLRIIGRFHG
jgi:hypothetical protein